MVAPERTGIRFDALATFLAPGQARSGHTWILLGRSEQIFCIIAARLPTPHAMGQLLATPAAGLLTFPRLLVLNNEVSAERV